MVMPRPPPSSHSVESESDDEFFDADNEPEIVPLASPSVSVPLTEEDPSDVEEDPELHEENDTGSEYTQHHINCPHQNAYIAHIKMLTLTTSKCSH